jgi:hypothetical protein
MMKNFSNFLVRNLSFSFAQANSRAPFLKIVPLSNSVITSPITPQVHNARKKIRKSGNSNLTQVGLKISLTKKGCSGLAYSMDYIRE